MAPYHDVPALRARLEATNIIHLVPAARAAGFRFRNGLSKAQIIDGLARYPAMLSACVATLEKTPAPSNAADWIDEPEPTNAPAPIPTPTPTPIAQASAQAIDLSEYATREWARGEILAAEGRSARRVDAVSDELNTHAALIKELQEQRPLALHFPERCEPLLINGLRHPRYVEFLRALRAGLHCALIGGAGTGKTTATEQAARDLGLKYYKEKPFTFPHEVLGHFDARNNYHRTPTREAVENGGLICFDEADRSTPEALIALNAVLDTSEFVAFPDQIVRKHPDFRGVFAGNTDGSGATMQYTSASRQDGSTLDRLVTFQWDIDERIESNMARGHEDLLAAVRAIRKFVSDRGIMDVLGTPRATKHGAILLESGMARPLILEVTCKRGALVEAWSEVLRLPAVVNFLRGE